MASPIKVNVTNLGIYFINIVLEEQKPQELNSTLIKAGTVPPTSVDSLFYRWLLLTGK